MLDELLPLLRQIAPDAAVWGAVVVYVVRIVRKELAEQRTARASTSSIGGRVGALDRDLTRLEDALAAQGLYVPGVSGRRDDQADDVDELPTAQRVTVPPLPLPKAGSYARHSRTEKTA
jgi:hypothetical protein